MCGVLIELGKATDFWEKWGWRGRCFGAVSGREQSGAADQFDSDIVHVLSGKAHRAGLKQGRVLDHSEVHQHVLRPRGDGHFD